MIPTFTVVNSPISSYAAIAGNLVFPERDQGLILDRSGELNLTNHMYAVGDIVNPKNVLFAFRISSSRVCLYLSSKELVDNITNQHENIQIGQEKVNIKTIDYKK